MNVRFNHVEIYHRRNSRFLFFSFFFPILRIERLHVRFPRGGRVIQNDVIIVEIIANHVSH